jgi:amino acid adenylation domain-containing protein
MLKESMAAVSNRLSEDEFEPSTLVELLRRRARQRPLQTAYTFLSEGEAEESSLTYEELDRRARGIGARLQALGAEGQCAVLLYPPGLEYIAAFFGCLYAGVVAIPAYPPRRQKSLPRLRAILANSGAKLALTNKATLSATNRLLAAPADSEELHWLVTDAVEQDESQGWLEPSLSGDTLAFIQYTSGSTATPKGVMLSHGNLLFNQKILRAAFEHTEQSVIVGWLPLYHDMGLIGNIFQPLYLGSPCVLMSPLHFLQQPVRWLQAITRYKATTSGGPDFAYDLCARKITSEQREGLDLSSWRAAFDGAEPVRAQTLERFAAAFEPCGFRREAFYPCYGLAEATLIVSGGRVSAPPFIHTVEGSALERNLAVAAEPGHRDARSLVGCGRTFPEQRILIVEPEARTVCAPGEVGEIWVSGPSVAAGYWNQAEETEDTFHARLADSDEGPFLRTGDLGFLHQGELFVTGRLKDLIIIRGRNHYPQDIELTVEQSALSVRPNCGAAFSVEADGEERLVVVQEVTPHRQADAGETTRAIRQAIAEQHELQTYSVTLIRAGTLPKTSSGKIRRRDCRAMFLAGELEVVEESRQAQGVAPENVEEPSETSLNDTSSTREWLFTKVAALTGARPAEVDLSQPLVSYGLDSIAAIQLSHEIESRTGVSIPLPDFFGDAGIATLADIIDTELSSRRPQAENAGVSLVRETDGALSYGQRALWFLYQLNPADSAYNIARAARIRGSLNVAALRRAFQALTQRHTALRTTFGDIEGELRRRVHTQAEADFQSESAEHWTEEDLRARLALEAHRPFDLERGPLVRARVFERGPDERVFLFVIHHIVADLWSLVLLFGELWSFYEAEVTGEPAAPASAPADFSNYVSWQKRLLDGSAGARLRDYWNRKLGGELPVTRLPSDRHQSVQAPTANAGREREIRISPGLTRSLQQFSQSHGTTLYVTLLTAFVALLQRYTGQTDILLGSIASGRSHAEFAQTIGLFVNPLALRADASQNPSFEALLAQMTRTVQQGLEQQDYPFALLVESLQPARGTNSSPLFAILFNFQKAPRLQGGALSSFLLGLDGAGVELKGFEVESIGIEMRDVQFELSLTMTEDEAGLAGVFEFDSTLFDGAMIERLSGHFESLLGGLIAGPHRRLNEMPLLTAGESRQLLAWNSTAKDYPFGQRMHDLFSEQVKKTPEAVALIEGQRRLTYRHLNTTANRTAHYLRSLGVGPETLVGVFLNRSLEMVACILGILKAGGAYLPLDINYPKERLAFMMEDAKLSFVLTKREFLQSLPSDVAHAICLDDEEAAIERQSVEDPFDATTDGNLAYVIYTSGSTGRPNGTAIEHRSAAAFLHWSLDTFTQGELASVMASTSICFDLSVFELFAPLCSGGRVVIVENAMQLVELDAETPVTLINSVPSALEQILRYRPLPSSVRTVNLAGEPLPRKLADALYANAGVEKVYNLYGPSEDTTYSTFALIERHSASAPPIGRPIDNTQVYLLDAGMNPVPVGVPGELYLGGHGLARGYFNQPRLTATKFIPNPFSTTGGARLYRTGDLARFREGGEIEFLGRVDHQVKLRGFRIELGEVETILAAYPGIAEVVVTVKKERSGEPCLAAYFVPNVAGSLETAAVLSYLREKLPAYLVPSFLCSLDALPRTPNGKLDRASLPAPDARTGSPAQLLAPRTAVEREVAAVWEEVLQRGGLGVEENFFESGGSSLKLLDVLMGLERRFERRISINSLFKYPTISSLADFLSHRDQRDEGRDAVQRSAQAQRSALRRLAKPRRGTP